MKAAVAVMAMLVAVAAASNDAEIKQLLQQGDKLLLQGRKSYQDAIAKYTQAINIQPRNVKAVYRRAELYSMTKQLDEMSADLDVVLSEDPMHKQGLTLRAKQLASQGKLEKAAEDYDKLVNIFTKLKKSDKAAKARSDAADARRLGETWGRVDAVLQRPTLTMEERIEASRQCVEVLAEVVDRFAKDTMELRIRRANCARTAKDHGALSQEVKHILKRDPHNLPAIVLGAQAFRALGAIEQARSEVKRCLGLDQEFKPCRDLHKLLKSYEKQMTKVEAAVNEKSWQAAVEQIDVALSMEDEPPNVAQLWKWKCEAFLNLRDVPLGKDACSKVLVLEEGDKNPNTVEVHLWLADLNIMDDDLDAASQNVNNANAVQPNERRVQEYQQKIEKLKKIRDRKDYYKILGVKRTANDQEIRRAFRKLAMRLHPDQLRSKDMTEKEREANDNLFRDINEAKEMLLDEDKRRRYDNGEDVTKPPEQQHGGGGFHHGGGGFHFHFG